MKLNNLKVDLKTMAKCFYNEGFDDAYSEIVKTGLTIRETLFETAWNTYYESIKAKPLISMPRFIKDRYIALIGHRKLRKMRAGLLDPHDVERNKKLGKKLFKP